jgi:hypothetical protein
LMLRPCPSNRTSPSPSPPRTEFLTSSCRQPLSIQICNKQNENWLEQFPLAAM